MELQIAVEVVAVHTVAEAGKDPEVVLVGEIHLGQIDQARLVEEDHCYMVELHP